MEIKDNDTYEYVNHKPYLEYQISKIKYDFKLFKINIQRVDLYSNNAGFGSRLVKPTNIICNYKNGVYHGEYKEYDSENNTIILDCNYKEGKLNGDYKSYFNGKLSKHNIYNNGIIEQKIKQQNEQKSSNIMFN